MTKTKSPLYIDDVSDGLFSCLPSKKTLTRLGSPTRSIPLNRWAGGLPRPHWRWRVRSCVEGACEGVDWDVELVSEEKEVVSVGYTFSIWFQAYDFYDLYDPLRSLFDWR